MMDLVLPAAALFLLLNLVAGMVRIYLGPTLADRMLAALLFSTTTVAVLLLMAEWMEMAALRQVALLFVMLASILTMAFVGLPSGTDEDPP